MIRALLWKELHEQAGRWLLAAILLAGATSLLVHARLISVRETTAITLMIGGMVLSIALIMAPLPSERTRGTLPFLLALPVRRNRVLFTKWLTGALSIAALYAVCALAGSVTAAMVGLDAAWMLQTAVPLCVSVLAFHSLVFLFLPRAKHELDAAMYAFFLAIIALIWSCYTGFGYLALWILGHLGPLAPAFALLGEGQEDFPVLSVPAATLLTTLVWIVVPAAWLLWFPIRRRLS